MSSRLLVSGAFAELDGDVHFFAAAIERHGYVVAGALVIESEVDVELAGDFLVVDGHDDVAADGDLAHACLGDPIATLNACVSGRPTVRGSLHKQAFFDGQVKSFA